MAIGIVASRSAGAGAGIGPAVTGYPLKFSLLCHSNRLLCTARVSLNKAVASL